MGIDLGDVVVRRPVTLAHFAQKRLAIDAWNILYQFLSSIRGPDGTPLLDREGRVTSHLSGILHRTGALVEAGIRPVFVFDGVPHALKGDTLAARAARKEAAEAALAKARDEGDVETARVKAQQTSRLTAPMVEDARNLLAALGIPVVMAPGEGEAQASWMAAEGLVDGVVSQDFDCLLFGAPLLVRHLATGGRRKLPGKQVWVDVAPEEVPLQASLEAAGLTRQQLVDAAILVGTDFHPGIKGIGAKTAFGLIRDAGSLDGLLRRLESAPAEGAAQRAIVQQRENLELRDEVRRIFLEPDHAPVEAGALALAGPDLDGVRRLMVDRHGFSQERVDKAVARFQEARSRSSQQRLF